MEPLNAVASVAADGQSCQSIMGNSSIIECSVDAAYWKSVGIEVLGARHRPRVLLDAEHRLGSTWGRVTQATARSST